ncbi:hypothetical protein [Flavobacterium sp.]
MYSKKKLFIYTLFLTATMLLVLLCLLVLIKNNNFKKEYSFNLGMPTKDYYENDTGCSLKKLMSFRKFKNYTLTNDDRKDNVKFRQIQLGIRAIVAKNDSENGIHVQFNRNTTYEEVVRALDICAIEKVPTYILKDYELWMMAGSNAELIKNCPFKVPEYLNAESNKE